ncbi:hypothetical protein BX666DRAFT_2120230 [Dichotomocladium elegans]|nr:hypothetical protein BX666DRAFT_2120230 [Dichotomocladium elegans]
MFFRNNRAFAFFSCKCRDGSCAQNFGASNKPSSMPNGPELVEKPTKAPSENAFSTREGLFDPKFRARRASGVPPFERARRELSNDPTLSPNGPLYDLRGAEIAEVMGSTLPLHPGRFLSLGT